jgi:hypothetical protein
MIIVKNFMKKEEDKKRNHKGHRNLPAHLGASSGLKFGNFSFNRST